MKLIKLNAIDSTNDFLKEMASDPNIPNFIVVTAENQIKGKGQRGTKWNSEAGKNLIVSILIKDLIYASRVFDLNIAVTLSVVSTLEKLDIPNLSIKWPNDIMSGKLKIGGILIENIIKSDATVLSIVGIGLNVNQNNFYDLPNASSLSIIKKTEFDREQILFDIIENLQIFTTNWKHDNIDFLWKRFNNVLFKKGIPMPFENQYGSKFMGIIQNVSSTGKLRILLEDDSINEFDVKEIRMLY